MSASNKIPCDQDILNRIRDAHLKGKGIRLSWAELEVLNWTQIGQIWSDADPREKTDGNHYRR